MISTVLGLIAVLFVGSLIVSGIAHTRQQEKIRKLKKIKAHRQQANEAYVLLVFLLKIDPENEVALFLHNILVTHLGRAHDLDPSDPVIVKELKNAATISAQILDESRKENINPVIESDNELRSSNFQILQISKLVEIHRNNSHIPLSQAESLLIHLQQVKLDIEIASHIRQAENYASNDDAVMCTSHLKQVLDVLKKTQLQFEGKAEMIRSLLEAIKTVKKTQKFDSSMLTANHKQDAQPKEEQEGECQ